METIVREAEPGDAQALLDYARRLFAEPHLNIPVAPDEFTMSLAEQVDRIALYRERPNWRMLLALDETGRIVGMLECHGSPRRALLHATELTVSVAKASRGQGIGTQLLRAAQDWARQGGVVARIELSLYARNEAARRLYERLGFRVEGRRRRAIREGDRYLDELIMAWLVEAEEAEPQG